MSIDLAQLQADFPDLIPVPLSRPRGATAYRLKLPLFNPGREFSWAELWLPRGFPEQDVARVVLSPDAVLRIPHVEASGALCLSGDPGPVRELSTNDRVLSLLIDYQERFLQPWQEGSLDGDHDMEPLNYWDIRVVNTQSPNDPVSAVWTVDRCPDGPRVRDGRLVQPSRIVIADDATEPITDRVIATLGLQAKQQVRVRIAEIPIAYPLTPANWPRTATDLDRLLQARLRREEYARFSADKRCRGGRIHRIALLRHLAYSFAFLLPGGPATVVDDGRRRKTYPSRSTLLPLTVHRIDPSWTVGRDQLPEVASRQDQYVLVLGAGALGSTVVEHLARAGIGRVTLVDADVFNTANLGRHLLGAESLGMRKSLAVAQRVNHDHPATRVIPKAMTAQRWLQENTLDTVDLVVDLTGESDVRWAMDQARWKHTCPWLIGWMEPFVATAHVCCLPQGAPWIHESGDLMRHLEAVDWPGEVMRQEPGCSSRFQSYTATAAAYAVALIAENILNMLDVGCAEAKVISWVRGQRYLDAQWPGLVLREWAGAAATHDGLLIERSFP